MTAPKRVLASLSLACAVTCQPTHAPSTNQLPLPCPAARPDVSAWTVIDRHDFAFRLPPDFTPVPVQGIDSWVEQFATSDSTEVVDFDYGGFSGDLHRDPGAFSEYRSCTETIGGRQALVVVVRLRNELFRSQDLTYGAGATWRDVRNRNHLTLWTWTRDPVNLQRLLGVLRTVRFPQD